MRPAAAPAAWPPGQADHPPTPKGGALMRFVYLIGMFSPLIVVLAVLLAR
ncbi:hypothetical protein [Streptomyces sp. CC53]|nr:hypothetical protein [Streptomyces sp. CC53]